MITDTMCEFDTLKLAIELGFNTFCQHTYCPIPEKDILPICSTEQGTTQSLLQKYLREKHEIDIEISSSFSRTYGAVIYRGKNPQVLSVIGDDCSYEKVLEAGLIAAMNIIKESKA